MLSVTGQEITPRELLNGSNKVQVLLNYNTMIHLNSGIDLLTWTQQFEMVYNSLFSLSGVLKAISWPLIEKH
jgi:hypothetical protein